MTRIKDLFGIPWHLTLKKGQDFSLTFKYLGFQGDLTLKTVSIPDKKRCRALLKLSLFLSNPRVSQKDCVSLHGSLQHISFVYRDTCCALPALSTFLSKFPNDYVLHHTPHTMISNMDMWLVCLSGPTMSQSLMLSQHLDLNLHVDASSSFGLGFMVDNWYAGWHLTEGWATDDRDIGWAESVALEMAIIG